MSCPVSGYIFTLGDFVKSYTALPIKINHLAANLVISHPALENAIHYPINTKIRKYMFSKAGCKVCSQLAIVHSAGLRIVQLA
jgi:hypothetical protein